MRRKRVVTVAVWLAVVATLALLVTHLGSVTAAVDDTLGSVGRTIDSVVTAFSTFMRTWGMPSR